MNISKALLIFLFMPVSFTAILMGFILTETRAHIVGFSIIYGIYLLIYTSNIIALFNGREVEWYGKVQEGVDNESPWPKYIRVLGEEEDIESRESPRGGSKHERQL